MNKLSSLLIASLISCSAFADSIPKEKPDTVGVSAKRLERITEMAQRYVDEKKIAGIITMVNRGGKLIHFEAVGAKGAEDSRKLKKNDLFRIYSMTKPITAVAAMQLYEQGKFYLNDPVTKFVPELKNLKRLDEEGNLVPVETPITMHHLLTHTAGFSYGFNPADPVDKLYREAGLWESSDLTDFAEKLAELPLKYEPGTQWHYSVAVDVTGLVIERITGQSFDVYLHENIFEPLGMKDTFFEVPKSKQKRFLPNHFWDRKDTTLRQIKPRQPAILGSKRAMSDYTSVSLFSGGGGLVSTASDYMRFAEMLRNGGGLGKARILSPKTIKYMATNHLSSGGAATSTGEQLLGRAFNGYGFGLGFGVLESPVENRTIGSKGTFMWGGAAGTIFWVDPEEDIVVVAMMQIMASPWPFRDDLRIATYQALIESYE